MPALVKTFNLPISALGHLTSAVQFGFITGTLIFAFLTITDRFSPSRIFFFCAIIGAGFNFGILAEQNNFASLLILRFLTGFSLAGIYPVGMKIASDYFKKGLGRSLGFLVGALVLGTAFPHLLQVLTGEQSLEWRFVIMTTSILAATGGSLILLLVPDGPMRTQRTNADFRIAAVIFKESKFRSAAFGYFGHMWELYAFWTFIPFILNFYKLHHPETEFSIALISFLVIASGSLSCISGGYLSETIGTKKVAAIALTLSGVCCLLSPLMMTLNMILFIIFLIFWGMVVVADSPLFSTLVARNAPEISRGTALTIVNSIGFAITILSIQLINYLSVQLDAQFLFMVLALGPLLGLYGLSTHFLFNKSK